MHTALDKTAAVRWHRYRYLPYERELAKRELLQLRGLVAVTEVEDGMRLTGSLRKEDLRRLVYFREFEIGGEWCNTLQHDLEKSASTNGTRKRQSTRYSVHGMHEYKGKFNPQVVRGVLNLLGIQPNSHVIDPFCGSGTALVESAHVRLSATGLDLNPLAVYIANAKLKALATPASTLRTHYVQLSKALAEGSDTALSPDASGLEHRNHYLQRWFDSDKLREFELLRAAIHRVTTEYDSVFLALASDIIRDYSLQEPTDLRIRRRFSPYPDLTVRAAFERKVLQFMDTLSSAQKVVGVVPPSSAAYLCDSRFVHSEESVPKPEGGFHAAVCSPPYATALPYIDTQRLSLVWLGLIPPSSIATLESELVGSREFAQAERQTWAERLIGNSSNLPPQAHAYCLQLHGALSQDDGFRRQAVPALIYRYLSGMQDVFRAMAKVMQQNAPFALIVGHNRTTLGTKGFNIDTPSLLLQIALHSGWTASGSIPLQTYQRYGLHAANAVLNETLLIVRRK